MPPSRQSDEIQEHHLPAVDAIESERQRIAARLQQLLVNPIQLMITQAQAYEQTSGDPQARMALSVMGSLARQLLQHVYDLEADLHPAILDSLGLEAALETYARQQRRISGLQIALSLPHLRERLPAHLELSLYRLIQDAVERVVGMASTMLIVIEYNDSSLLLTIHDNGMPPQADILRATRQRVEMLGASWSVQKSRYGGAEIAVRLRTRTQIEWTNRELDVLRLLGNGLTNKEIARDLQISARTIKFHLDNIYSKLGVNTRTEAAIYALQSGIFQGDDLSG